MLATFFNIRSSLMLPTDGGEYSTVLNGIMMIGNIVQSLRDRVLWGVIISTHIRFGFASPYVCG